MTDKSEVKAEASKSESNKVESDSFTSRKSESGKAASDGSTFSKQIGESAARKIIAQRYATKTIWSGLGMMGLVGWSVAIPTLLGAILGLWLDKHYPSGRSATLMLLVAGLCLGCFNAWRWVDKEYREIHRHDDGDDLD